MDALHTYSLVKALYDEGSDYIDAFWPFVVHSLPLDTDAYVAPAPLADRVAGKFSLAIPVHTIDTFANRARRAKGFVVRRSGAYAITHAGIEYVRSTETSRQVERRLASLIAHASDTLSVQDALFADREFTAQAITEVIETHRRIFDYADEQPRHRKAAGSSAFEEMILDYFGSLEHEQPQQFDTLRDLILGTTLAGLLKRDEITDATRQFQRTQLFLDTNVLLSLLDLRFETACRPARELLALLNSSARFELAAFDFTVFELTRLLSGYAKQWKRYDPAIQVDDLYSSLRFRKFTPADVALLVANIENRLTDLGISVKATGISVDTDNPALNDAMGRLQAYKPDQDVLGRRHDIIAIECVAKMRRGQIRRVEDGQAFFLTEDYRLSNYANIERSHHQNRTISEVMPDRLLTNLLWLKKPDTLKQVPIATVITMHSRDLFVNRQVWQLFYTCVEQLTDDGTISVEAVDVLLHDAQVGRDLASIQTDEHRTVSRQWVLDKVVAAGQRAQARQEAAIAAQVKNVAQDRDAKLHALVGANDAARRESERRINDLTLLLESASAEAERRRNRQLANEKRIANRQASLVIHLLRFVSISFLALCVWKFGALMHSWLSAIPGFFDEAPYIGAATLWIAGISFDPRRFWRSLTTKLAESLLSRRVRRYDAVTEGAYEAGSTGGT